MICNNCGKDNKGNMKFCSNCGAPLKNKSDKKFKIAIISIIAIIFIIFGYHWLDMNLFNSPKVVDLDINEDYRMEGDTFIFDVNDEKVSITPEIESKKSVQLKGVVDNTNIATCYKAAGTCHLFPKKTGKSKLTMYDNDKILYVMEFEFRDGLYEKESEQKQYYSEDENSYVPSVEIGNLMSNYLNGYSEAVNAGDFSLVSDYMYEGSPEYEDTRKSILSTYEKGTKIYLYDYETNEIEKISDGKYKVSCTVEWNIENDEGERLQKESADYIVYNFDNSYKIYSMKNWKLISKEYL